MVGHLDRLAAPGADHFHDRARLGVGHFDDERLERVTPLLGSIESSVVAVRAEGDVPHGVDRIEDISEAAKLVRSYGEKGDPLARKIFEQQAMAIGRLFTIASRFTDPDAYFVGGGVAESAPEFRDWFLATVRDNTSLEEEQEGTTTFALVEHLDMAGARGAALAALEAVREGSA